MNLTISNHNNQKIAVSVNLPKQAKGLVFIAHGLGGFKEQAHIVSMKNAFHRHGYIVVRWDARNTIGESEGLMEDATISSYFDDYELVVSWASKQSWYKEPFVVVGHSLGAACAVLFTIKYPKKVKALAPLSLFTSGSDYTDTFESKELSFWKKTGIREWISSARPGLLKRIKWDFMIDAYKYDLLKKPDSITMPVLLIVGSKDNVTPLALQQKFYNLIPTLTKELHVIKGAVHTYRQKDHLSEVEDLIGKWLVKLK